MVEKVEQEEEINKKYTQDQEKMLELKLYI
jgi:hypothetical protein